MSLSRTVPARLYARLGFGLLSVCGVLLAGGCGTDAAKPKPAEHEAHEHGAGGHPEEGPHHGQLIELGKEEYHAELVHDDAVHKITIYLLDGAAKQNVAIADRELMLNVVAAGKPQQFKLVAVPQADDAAGQSSRFELVDQTLCEALDDSKTTGRLNVTIAGKPFAGEVSHAAHDDHKH